jgi:hypothetical protein
MARMSSRLLLAGCPYFGPWQRSSHYLHCLSIQALLPPLLEHRLGHGRWSHFPRLPDLDLGLPVAPGLDANGRLDLVYFYEHSSGSPRNLSS